MRTDSPKHWLVTGGTGYIGSHVVLAMLDAGHQVVVVDDFSSSPADWRDRYDRRVFQLSGLDITSTATERLESLMYGAAGVIHLAGVKDARRSACDHYRVNVGGTVAVLDAMHQCGVERILLASSAAVHETSTPYGRSKAAAEHVLQDVAGEDGLDAIALRYYNVIGNSPGLFDTSPHNLVPATLAAVARGQAPVVYGNDYPTQDGTTIRDYIDVRDLARLHVAWVDDPQVGYKVFDVGGTTSSTDQIVRVLSEVPPDYTARRAGDPASVVCTCHTVWDRYQWQPQISLADSLRSAQGSGNR